MHLSSLLLVNLLYLLTKQLTGTAESLVLSEEKTCSLAWLIAAFVTSLSPVLDFYLNKNAVTLHAHPLTRTCEISLAISLSGILAAFWKHSEPKGFEIICLVFAMARLYHQLLPFEWPSQKHFIDFLTRFLLKCLASKQQCRGLKIWTNFRKTFHSTLVFLPKYYFLTCPSLSHLKAGLSLLVCKGNAPQESTTVEKKKSHNVQSSGNVGMRIKAEVVFLFFDLFCFFF